MSRIFRVFRSLPIQTSFKILFFYFVRSVLKLPVYLSYSQTGEDIILRNLISRSSDLYYIDVGCNEPIRRSNTFWMYLNGGRGICIDANEELTRKFKKIRKRDTVICAVISNVERETKFYISKKKEVSTIDQEQYFKWKGDSGLLKEVNVKTLTLNKILSENLNHGQSIDVLSIDVEGHDFEVLSSVDLNVFRPRVIIIEIHGLSFRAIEKNKIISYLTRLGYELTYYATMNAYFIDCR